LVPPKVVNPVPPLATATVVKPEPNVPAVKVPVPVIPVYDPEIPADWTTPVPLIILVPPTFKIEE